MESLSSNACQRGWTLILALYPLFSVAKNVSATSIEANLDRAEVQPLLPFLVGDEVLFAQALVREARVVLIDKHGFHHAGAAQNFDMLRGLPCGTSPSACRVS